MDRLRPYRADLFALGLLVFLPLLWFAPVILTPLTGLTLLPFDNLYTFEPWRSLQPQLVAHNQLLSDLVLENAVWKLHIRRTLASGQLPLWNPQIFTGLPFLAAGQASTFYPLNILFYILPLPLAYGWFTALQIGLAGAGMYAWGRSLQLRWWAALVGGAIFQFSGFLIASVVFTMFIAAVAWLPLLLATIEWMVRKQEEKGVQGYNPMPFVALGALSTGCLVLAGHPELIYYTMLVAGAYTVTRLGVARRYLGRTLDRGLGGHINRRLLGIAAWLASMAVLGVALGGVQLLPLLELVPLNFREGSVSLAQVRGWAWPDRHVLTFFLPNIFGNPSHHAWFDLWAGRWQPVTHNALGESIDNIFWGIKNYVEGANYLSLLTWLLAAVALCYGAAHVRRAVRAKSQPDPGPSPTAAAGSASASPHPEPTVRPWVVWFCAGLAVVALLFAFGTPLYALLFYGLPGWSQLHSPFRWVFPYTLSMAMLAAVGLQALANVRTRPTRRVLRGLALLAILAGGGALLAVLVGRLQPALFTGMGEALLARSELAQRAFAGGRMAAAYLAMNIVHFGTAALLAGGWLWWAVRWSPANRSGEMHGEPDAGVTAPRPDRRWTIWVLVGLALVVGDLYAAHGRFNPAAPAALSPLTEAGTPPVVEFLNAREAWPAQTGTSDAGGPPLDLWRFTTFNAPGERTFNANVGMYYGWHDLRGYDSIIPRQYVQLMERIAPQENELLYNRIAPLYSRPGGDVYTELDSPLLDLLNVRYVLTEHAVPNPGWEEIYRDEAIGVYENREAFPRAFIVPRAEVRPPAEQPLTTADLREVVYVEETPPDEALAAADLQVAEARVSRYTAIDLFVDVNLSEGGWLVVGDAYFPGWKAYLRPFGSEESDERELPIYRADGGLRAVYLPEGGQWTVRMVYSPMSFKLGLYTSFLAGMTLLLLGLYWGWGKYYRPETTAGEVRTVAKNSVVPMALNLTNKAIDFAFAMLYVRLLGPAGTGQYAFVVAIYGFFEIISRYGLGTLLTRDVAADKDQSSRYLTNVLVLRTLLWAASMPLLALVTFGYRNLGQLGWTSATGISMQEVQAIALLALAMLFANWADAFSSMFHAFEKMEYPAGLTNAIALFKVTLGALVLLLGWGYVGLAGVSLAMNVVQLLWLAWLVRTTLFRPQWRLDFSLQRWMAYTSGPLMLNHLLATVFWRIDVWILRPLAGSASVGLYSVGLKYLDGLNIVPSVFTMAVFPLMSRYAREANSSLLRAYVLSLRLLILVSLPLAMTVTVLAEPLVWLVGGGQYLGIEGTVQLWGREFAYVGGSDLALRVIIWSIPIGFANSVTQYVLIAVNQQHFLTRAFVLGVIFNVVGNLLMIPRFGYVGAAAVTILSEFSLLFPFYFSVRRHVGTVPWLDIFWRPVLATALMGATVYGLLLWDLNLWLAAAAGGAAYLIGLVLLGELQREEVLILRQALPWGKAA